MPTETKEWTPERIKALRKRLGVSQEECAAMIGTSMSSFQNWEYGVCTPRKHYQERLVALESGDFSNDDLATLRKKSLDLHLLGPDLGMILAMLSENAQKTILEAVLKGR